MSASKIGKQLHAEAQEQRMTRAKILAATQAIVDSGVLIRKRATDRAAFWRHVDAALWCADRRAAAA